MPENGEQPVAQALVICGTCDLCYRIHAGRRTCPACGGEPLAVFMDLHEEPAQEDNGSLATEVPTSLGAGDEEPPPEPAPREHSPDADGSSLPTAASGEPSDTVSDPAPLPATEAQEAG